MIVALTRNPGAWIGLAALVVFVIGVVLDELIYHPRNRDKENR